MSIPSNFMNNSVEHQIESRLISVSHVYSTLSPQIFLRHARGLERFYWADRNNQKVMAGFGIAVELMAWGENRFEDIQTQAQELFHHAMIVSNAGEVGPRLFGGFAFRDDFVPDNTWAVFPPANFILPHYQLTQIGDRMWLTINAILSEGDDEDDARQSLQDALDARYEALCATDLALNNNNPSTSINYPMPYKVWEKKIVDATQLIHTSELEKVVLSRVCEIQFKNPIEVENALNYLDRHYADCYRFLFEPRAHHAFFGATPELLANVHDKHLNTMGLAGSVQRGKTLDEDEAFADQLLNDSKERHEHALVVDAIKNRLSPLTKTLDVPTTPIIYKLNNIQHLHTPIHGVLDENLGILAIVETLHPTPALGGTPRHLANDVIRESESVPRGWYAAPIGWIDHELNGEFGVAIRSAVCQDRRIWLYAGAGIVGESIPQKEWDETGLKFRPILHAMGIE